MKVIFDNVVIHGFMAFEHADISLNDLGYVLVSGRNTNPSDNAKSNGSGKSTIFESICWCLTGETMRGGSKDIRNHYTSGGAFVDLTFSVDDHKYRLIRSKEHSEYKTNLSIYIDGEDKSGKGIKDSEKLLASYLPDLTSEVLCSSIILGQGLPYRFSSNTPSGRKEVLEKLSKSDFMVEDLKNRVADRKALVADSLKSVEEELIRLNTTKTLYDGDLLRKKETIASLSSFDVASAEKEFNDLTNTCNALSNAYDTKASEVTDIEKQIEDASMTADRIQTAKREMIDSIIAKFFVEKSVITEDLATNRAEKKRIAEVIAHKESVIDVCPTCGQHIDGAVKQDTSEDKKYQAEVEEKIAILQNKLSALDSQMKKACDEASADFDKELKEVSANKDSYCARRVALCEGMTLTLKDRYDASAKAKSIRETIDRHDLDYKTAVRQLEEIEKSIKEFSDKIMYNTNRSTELSDRLSALTKFETVLRRDFRGYLLGDIINGIDKKFKHYSQKVFGHSNVSLVLDGNLLDIYYTDRKYEDLSGGERQKLDIIMQLSLREMLCDTIGFSSNIIAFDEVFDNLDSTGCQKILDVISTEICDVSSVFIITHHSSDFAIPCDREIVVEKNSEGISRVI